MGRVSTILNWRRATRRRGYLMWFSTLPYFRGQGLLFSLRWTESLHLLPISLGVILLFQQPRLALALLVFLQALQLLREYARKGRRLERARRNERLALKRRLEKLEDLAKQRKEYLTQVLDTGDIKEFHLRQRGGRR